MTNTNNNNRIGLQLKDARKKAQLTQKQLAELVGIHSNHLAMVEAGRKNPSVSLIERISLATGASFDWGATPSSEKCAVESAYEGSSDAEEVISLLKEKISGACCPDFNLKGKNFPGTNWTPDFWCICEMYTGIERWAFDITPCAPELHGTKDVDPQYLFANFITNILMSNDLIRDSTKYSIVVPNSMLFNMYLKQVPIPIGNVSLVEVNVFKQEIVREVHLCKRKTSDEYFPPFFDGHENRF